MTASQSPTDQISAVLNVVQDTLRQAIAGIYLYGSAVMGELRPASDLDLLVVTQRGTSESERALLVRRMTLISSRLARPDSWRPLELTVVVGSDVRPWRYPPRMDFQYGEWLRDELDAGKMPSSSINPDLAVLVAMVLLADRPLTGPPPRDVLDPVPSADLVRAMRAGMPDLLGDLESDTTNVLLTLARIWYTIATGELRSKDSAAEWVIQRLPPEHRAAISRAREIYLGTTDHRWEMIEPAVQASADFLVIEIDRSAGVGEP